MIIYCKTQWDTVRVEGRGVRKWISFAQAKLPTEFCTIIKQTRLIYE